MEPRQPELEEFSTATAADVLKPVEAPSDGEGCLICSGQEEATETAWMKTACGHIFHGWCGSCPVCRHHLSIPHVTADKHVRPPNPMMLMTIEIMARHPEMYSSETYDYLRWYM
ncbi:hypothetical protein VPH35_050722 [Triticum aestivum]